MNVSKRALGAAAATILLASGAAFAADTAPAPLPAGKPAGTKEAALLGPTGLILFGLAVVGVGIGFAVSGGHHGVTTPSTSGTSNP